MSSTRLVRRLAFHCLHKYSVDAWSDDKNAHIFGACFTPHGHGHNYEMEAYLEGPVDPVTGMILNLTEVDLLLKEAVAPLAGKHLNLEVPELKGKVPTTEVLATFLFERVCKRVPQPARLSKLRLYEYENLWVDVWP